MKVRCDCTVVVCETYCDCDLTSQSPAPKALKTSSGRHQTIVEEDNRIIRSEIQNFPRKDKTCRGRYWWDTHEAKIKLKEDVAQGKHLTTKPKQLWLSRKIYQDFALSVFRGHIYQEKRRQKELPLRVARRNKVAAKKYKKEVDESKLAWENYHDNRLNES